VTEIRLNLYYPHPPERVWRAITDSRAIATWLMENDFAPRIGHRFRMRPAGLPGFDGLIDGEVTEIVPLSQVRMTWTSGEATADVTWVVRMAPGGSSMQIVHKGELGADQAGADRREALEQTYAVIFEQHLPLVLHDFAIEAGAVAAPPEAEGLPVTPAEGKDSSLEFPAAVEMDWVSAGQSSGAGEGAYGAVSGAGAYGGSVYGSAAGGSASSPVLAMPQVGSDYAWGNDISPPSGVSLGDGLSLGGYWSSDGSGFGAQGVPLNPAAAAAAERRRTRNLILLSIGSLVAVVVFVLGAWVTFSDPASPASPATAPTNGGEQSGFVGAPDTKATPKPGETTGPSTNPVGGQPGGQPGGNPGGEPGGNPQQTQPTGGDGGNTTPADPPAAAKPVKAAIESIGVITIQDVDGLGYRVAVKNPGTADADWSVTVKLPPTPVDLGHQLRVRADGDVSVSRSGRYVTFTPNGGSLGPGETVTFRFAVEGDVDIVACRVDDDRNCAFV
jgi:uncharacterized protein YndB with AHSA1/START domain